MEAKNFLEDRSEHHIRSLFVQFLNILEDIRDAHEINFGKLYKHLPEKYEGIVSMADYFDEDFFQQYRKRVLDIGNSALREHNTELEVLSVQFKFKS
jgi:hypothetical protein